MTKTINQLDNDQLDKAAELFHELWIEWTKYISYEQFYSVPTYVRNHWAKNWVAYDLLPEKEKEKDRLIARRFFTLLAK